MKKNRLFVVVPAGASDEDLFVLYRYFPEGRFRVVVAGGHIFDEGEVLKGVVLLPGWNDRKEWDGHKWLAAFITPLLVPPDSRIMVSL